MRRLPLGGAVRLTPRTSGANRAEAAAAGKRHVVAVLDGEPIGDAAFAADAPERHCASFGHHHAACFDDVFGLAVMQPLSRYVRRRTWGEAPMTSHFRLMPVKYYLDKC